MPRHLLSILDLEPWELRSIVDLALELKRRFYAGERVVPLLHGRSVALIFEKPSTRTRVSMEVAVAQLGGHPVVLRREELQLTRGETLADTARVLSRYVDVIAARVYRHESLEELARWSSVPVVNMLSDREHPLQAIADIVTMKELLGDVAGRKVVFIGDGANNVATSLSLAVVMMGGTMVVAAPREYQPREWVVRAAEKLSRITGGKLLVVEDPEEAVRNADVVYTDVWVSMGEEEVAQAKKEKLKPYKVTEKLMESAEEHAIFMHCLPAHRGEEVEAEVIDGPRSAVWVQAENRLHAQKAVLAWLVNAPPKPPAPRIGSA